MYFISWSMDVKFEGENVVRHLDMTTHNHASPITNTCPWPYRDTISAFGDPPECTKETQRVRKACKNSGLVYDLKTNKQGVWETSYRGVNCTRRCKKAMKCILVPKKDDKKKCCRPTTTRHHLIEDNWVKFNPNFPWYKSNREKDGFKQSIAKKNLSPGDRTVEDAPCICADNIHKKKGNHTRSHNVQGARAESYLPGGSRSSIDFTYGEGKKAALETHKLVLERLQRTVHSCTIGCILWR